MIFGKFSPAAQNWKKISPAAHNFFWNSLLKIFWSCFVRKSFLLHFSATIFFDLGRNPNFFLIVKRIRDASKVITHAFYATHHAPLQRRSVTTVYNFLSAGVRLGSEHIDPSAPINTLNIVSITGGIHEDSWNYSWRGCHVSSFTAILLQSNTILCRQCLYAPSLGSPPPHTQLHLICEGLTNSKGV